MVCGQHSDDVVCRLDYIGLCDVRGVCEFGEVCGRVQLGFVGVGVS